MADDEIVALLRVLADDRLGARRVPLLLADFERDQTFVGELLRAFKRGLVECAIIGEAGNEDGDFQFLRRDAGAGGGTERDDGGEPDEELQTRKFQHGGILSSDYFGEASWGGGIDRLIDQGSRLGPSNSPDRR